MPAAPVPGSPGGSCPIYLYNLYYPCYPYYPYYPAWACNLTAEL